MTDRRRSRFEVRLTSAAQRDVKAILNWSRREFGDAAAARYQALLKQALRDIANDPRRPGSQARPELLIPGARTYHLWFSRSRVQGESVKAPRHFLLYRSLPEGVIEVGRVLHDSRDLSQNLPLDYGRFEPPL